MRICRLQNGDHFVSASLCTLKPTQKGGTAILQRTFSDSFFLYENSYILINISTKLVPWGQINNDLALVQMMVWHRTGDKPLSEATMA